MKSIRSLIPLSVGLLIGLGGGMILTVAHSDNAFKADQVIAQIGETKITRGRLAEYAIAKVGSHMLTEELQDIAMVEEMARRQGVTVSAEEVNQRVDETFKIVENTDALNKLPRWQLTERLRTVILVEKMANITISPNEVELFYTTNPGLFFKPPMYDLICITTDNRTAAVRAYTRIKNGEDPKKVASSENTEEALRAVNGEIGWFSGNQISNPAISNAILEANDGKGLRAKQYTNVVESMNHDGETQYQVFYIKDFKPSKTPTLAEARPAATFYARSQKYSKEAPKWFAKQAQTLEWKQVGDLFDPASELKVQPIALSKYTARKTTQEQ